jgi:hypothetical protein
VKLPRILILERAYFTARGSGRVVRDSSPIRQGLLPWVGGRANTAGGCRIEAATFSRNSTFPRVMLDRIDRRVLFPYSYSVGWLTGLSQRFLQSPLDRCWRVCVRSAKQETFPLLLERGEPCDASPIGALVRLLFVVQFNEHF